MITKIKRSKVVSKYSIKGVQPMNGKLMFLDFPFKRPMYYGFEMENDDSLQVSASDYQAYQVGDSYSYYKEIWETQDYLILIGIVLLVILFIVFMISIA